MIRRHTRRSRLAPLAPVLFLAPATAAAEAVPGIDLNAEIGRWSAGPTGRVASDGDRFDVENDLDFGDTGANMFMAELEHPLPVLPNVRVSHVQLTDDSTTTLERTRVFGPVSFQTGERIAADYDIAMTDATLYYSPLPLDFLVELDLGLTARYIDTEVEISSRDRNQQESAGGSLVLPLIHAGARFDLPLTDVYAEGSIDALNAGGESLTDARAAIGWEPSSVVGVELGYRELSLEFDDVDDLDADVDYGGPYVAATIRF